MSIKIIAFYLPQYHPFPENDEWWGKGFTEWTNVGKAKPLFKGHNQPRVPTELGYYDLRLPLIREEQAKMAREAGITAFCYWHYWFGNGKRLIPDVFDEVLESGNPNFPFCLGWANHSWFAKNWNSYGTKTERLLIEQKYPGFDDERMHFDFLLKAFKDFRYLKIEGKPLLYIFDPIQIPQDYLSNFRKWTKKAGFADLFLVANISSPSISKEFCLQKGFDAVNFQKLGGIHNTILIRMGINGARLYSLWKRITGFLFNRPPFMFDYRKYYKYLIQKDDYSNDVIPSLMPQWDHTPRSGRNGSFFINATPEYFRKHIKDALNAIKNKPNQILFLKSWNEWGEGNMMEPDITFGRGFIDVLREEIDRFSNKE